MRVRKGGAKKEDGINRDRQKGSGKSGGLKCCGSKDRLTETFRQNKNKNRKKMKKEEGRRKKKNFEESQKAVKVRTKKASHYIGQPCLNHGFFLL